MNDDTKKTGTTIASANEATNQTGSDAENEQLEIEKIKEELLQTQVTEQKRKKLNKKSENTTEEINDDMQKYISDVQRDLLFELIMSMRHKLITVGGARRLAKDFIALFPFQTKEEVIEKMKKLSEKYAEARTVYLKYAVPHTNQIEKELIDKISQHLQSGDIEKAINVAKGGS